MLSCRGTGSDKAIQREQFWHNKPRAIHYAPSGDGESFVKVNGSMRFNRALYGSNTAFRVEAGDLPEFSLYMPGMGGNLKFGVVADADSKWLTEMAVIKTRYKPGAMEYSMQDPVLGDGEMLLTIAAMPDSEGMIVKMELKNITRPLDLVCAYGGVSGERFSRNGDIGADPESSFYLKPENCAGNIYRIGENIFSVAYGKNSRYGERQISGVFPENARLWLANPEELATPQKFTASNATDRPALAAVVKIPADTVYYFSLYNPDTKDPFQDEALESIYKKAEEARIKLTGRIKVKTPDPYINTLGGALSMAGDAIWEHPSYLHGAVAWRMRLPGWRGASVADPLGWHDRAKAHFRGYAAAQLTEPPVGVNVPDPERNWARQKEEVGVSLYSSGYITRNPNQFSPPHHYDMNLILFDQLLHHFNWTGDSGFVKEMWPYLERHLAWEKRCFDGDNDGLYDAYCCIWASDALQYSGGAVTHSSAINYRANKMAAQLGVIAGKDPRPYEAEAGRILKALNSRLWMPGKGWFAEYQDLLGFQKLHPAAGLWTVYHTIDSEVPDPFQAYQMMNYVHSEIPSIPVRAEGISERDLYVHSTTNWQPYTWSVNNVALAENLHTALAYWKSGKVENAFRLWKSALVESMYLGVSPGGFQQLSFYDAIRGELYRDFADPVGMAARTLVEGLFGIRPELMDDTLKIMPGLPREWEYASLETPDISFEYQKKGRTEFIAIEPFFPKKAALDFYWRAGGETVKHLTVNGVDAEWSVVEDAVGEPLIHLKSGPAGVFRVEISWKGDIPVRPEMKKTYAKGDIFQVYYPKAKILEIFDPQSVLSEPEVENDRVTANVVGITGLRTAFAKIKQGDFTWWQPLDFVLREPVEFTYSKSRHDSLMIGLINHRDRAVSGKLIMNPGRREKSINVKIAGGASQSFGFSNAHLFTGTNRIVFKWQGGQTESSYVDWNIKQENTGVENVNLSAFYNEKVSNIFKQEYRSPRSPYPTLQLPLTGIGNWCYPNITAEIDDSGIRNLAGARNQIFLPQGIPFATPGSEGKNILFVSLWDNFPDEATVPLKGRASHAYFLMAGTTNPMQSRIENGQIRIEYDDGSYDSLSLVNPETWHPIEQDYYIDGYAFSINAPKPVRVHLKTGWIGDDCRDYSSIPGFTGFAISGGAATVLDLPLDPQKELKSIKLQATANDVVIGLMSATLIRNEGINAP